jgi:hypothetical protein
LQQTNKSLLIFTANSAIERNLLTGVPQQLLQLGTSEALKR